MPWKKIENWLGLRGGQRDDGEVDRSKFEMGYKMIARSAEQRKHVRQAEVLGWGERRGDYMESSEGYDPQTWKQRFSTAHI